MTKNNKPSIDKPDITNMLQTIVSSGYKTKFKIGEEVTIKNSSDTHGQIERLQIGPSEGTGFAVTYCVIWFNGSVKNESWFYGFQLKRR